MTRKRWPEAWVLKAVGLLGYLLCEVSFRWFDHFKETPFEGDAKNHTKADVRWQHRLIMAIGQGFWSSGHCLYGWESPRVRGTR